MPKVFVQVKPSEPRIWDYTALTTPSPFFRICHEIGIISPFKFGLLDREKDWVVLCLGIPFSFVGITSSWPLPPSVLCSPHVYSMCRSSDAQHLSVACLHFLALYLEVPTILLFYIFFWEFHTYFLLYLPPAPRFFSTSLPSGLLHILSLSCENLKLQKRNKQNKNKTY